MSFIATGSFSANADLTLLRAIASRVVAAPRGVLYSNRRETSRARANGQCRVGAELKSSQHGACVTNFGNRCYSGINLSTLVAAVLNALYFSFGTRKLLPTYRPFCHAPGEPPAATTCTPGTLQGLAGPGRRCPARSAIASCIFGRIGPIAKLAAHA